MNSVFWIASAVAAIFGVLRFLEGRLLSQESRPLKDTIKDSILVYISVLGAMFVNTQLGGGGGASVPAPTVSLSDPSF